ncbi:MAG: hypothetical protein JST75_22325 [Bacteroidetes bacterium]|nr:hypothetical protein [Bacteroidota bacterium]
MDSLDYIDSYFKGELDQSEMTVFEGKIINDPAFAEAVASYLSIQQVAKEQAEEDKKKKFRELYAQRKTVNTKNTVRKLWPSLVVAALVAGIIFGLYVFVQPVSAKQLADRYIREQLQSLPVTMGARDSMQTAINLYNQEKLTEALKSFQRIIESDPGNFQAIQNAGLTSLRLQHYDRALEYFKQMETHKELYTNPSLIYQALTLMKRNDKGDAEKAKQLLQQITKENLEGKEVAGKWLEKL